MLGIVEYTGRIFTNTVVTVVRIDTGHAKAWLCCGRCGGFFAGSGVLSVRRPGLCVVPAVEFYHLVSSMEAVMARWQCPIEGCDAAHCTRCGHHYDPYEVAGGDVCAACQIEQAAQTAEAQAAAFGGNYEEAAKYWGW